MRSCQPVNAHKPCGFLLQKLYIAWFDGILTNIHYCNTMNMKKRREFLLQVPAYRLTT